jgi:hypothetical protein
MPDITLIPVTEEGRYLLIVQGLPHGRMEGIIEALRRMVETKGSIAVLEFAKDINWSIIKADDLKGAIIETTDETSDLEVSNTESTA